MKNILDVGCALADINRRYDKSIKYQCYRYQGVTNADNSVDPKVVEKQLEYLLADPPRVLKDIEAAEMLTEIK